MKREQLAAVAHSATSDIDGPLLDSMNVSFRVSNLAQQMSGLGRSATCEPPASGRSAGRLDSIAFKRLQPTP